ncbi:hypothetical protein [Candidatus Contendibacter odensensis]|jgi:hypothetical protein|uniref:Uncharacterized protein n=1 Tax=Candidatus Contendobacter odensis Run_B_J11 TaxID=1400861 RepID=A0A7U7GAT8_9GAMM|nr:hypothetical protein [Candidatus Contendobacter odensis]MBK8752275.1 hypothetical protein [Candidatus Competibacteraceae bacterium]CDH44750.1 hypothetical protein BN874_1860014 [Candidatus Contendobacter odensis Run_B_J11]
MKNQPELQTAQQIILTLNAAGWSDNRIGQAIQRPQSTISRIRTGLVIDPGESIGIALRRLIQPQPATSAPSTAADRANDPLPTPAQNRENRHARRPQNPMQS